MQEAREMGAPECFSEEYAFLERTGGLPPYAGPVEPDWGSDASYLYDDEPTEPPGWSEEPDPEWVREPEPCQGPARTFEFLGLPGRWRAHEGGCWDLHVPSESCPPPF
jgi:hypothetical protein